MSTARRHLSKIGDELSNSLTAQAELFNAAIADPNAKSSQAFWRRFNRLPFERRLEIGKAWARTYPVRYFWHTRKLGAEVWAKTRPEGHEHIRQQLNALSQWRFVHNSPAAESTKILIPALIDALQKIIEPYLKPGETISGLDAEADKARYEALKKKHGRR